MKNKEVDFDESILKDEEAFKKRFRLVEGKERDELRARIAKARSASKDRVTMYLDSDIVRYFKDRAEIESSGYQTLINSSLRQMIDIDERKGNAATVKDDILKDKKFLKRLKSALAS